MVYTPETRTRLGLPWSPEDDAFLRSNHFRGQKKLAELLRRSPKTVTYRARRLGVKIGLADPEWSRGRGLFNNIEYDTNGPGCWFWVGALSRAGYPLVRINNRTTLGNRHAWILANGPIPDGLCVLHRCDVPACINPAHLFLGTHADNMADMAGKGRAKRKTRRPHRLLSGDTRLSIISDLKAGVPKAATARRLGVSVSGVRYYARSILSGEGAG